MTDNKKECSLKLKEELQHFGIDAHIDHWDHSDDDIEFEVDEKQAKHLADAIKAGRAAIAAVTPVVSVPMVKVEEVVEPVTKYKVGQILTINSNNTLWHTFETNTVVKVIRIADTDVGSGENKYLVEEVDGTLDQYLLESQLDERQVDPKTEIGDFKFEVGKIYSMESNLSDYTTTVLVNGFADPAEGKPVLIGMRVDSDGDIMPIDVKTGTHNFENFKEVTDKDARGEFLHKLVKEFVREGDFIVAEAAWSAKEYDDKVLKVERTSAGKIGIFPVIYGEYVNEDNVVKSCSINGIKNFRKATDDEIAEFEKVADPKLTAPDGSEIKEGSVFKTMDFFNEETYLVVITKVDAVAKEFDIKKLNLTDMEISRSPYVQDGSAYFNNLKPVTDAEKVVIEKVLMG